MKRICLLSFLPLSFLFLQPVCAQIAAMDQSFLPEGTFSAGVNAVAVQPDGKVIFGGNFTTYNSTTVGRIIRLKADGAVDDSFNAGTGFGSGIINDIALQPDGKMLVVGTFTDYNGLLNVNRIVRLNADGSLDPSFAFGTGLNGTGNAVLILPDGKILVSGGFSSYNGSLRNRLVRINADGSIDNTFSIGTGFGNDVYAIAVQPDGKVLAGGAFTQFNSIPSSRLARLNTDGSFDSSFSIGDGFSNSIYTIALQDDGKIMVGGAFTAADGTTANRIARLSPSGQVDTGLATGSGFNSSVNRIVVDGNGNMVVGGLFTTFNAAETRNRVARLLVDGSIDYSFNPGTGFNSTVEDIAIQSDGRIVLVGSFTQYNGVSVNRVIRLLDHAITANAVSPSGAFCAGQSGVVSFSITGGFNAGNVFTAQLSDHTGNFSSPIGIGTLTSNIGGSIPFVLPAGANSGTAYRIRVISSDPPVTGTDLGATSNITISAVPSPNVNITVSPSMTFCAGTEVTFTATPASGGNNPTYQWFIGDDAVTGETGSTFTTNGLLDGDQIRVSMVSDANCSDGEAVVSNTITVTVQPVEVPAVSIESSAGTEVCSGQSVTFTATASDAGSFPAYQWTRNGSNVGLGASTYTTATLSDGDVIVCEVFSNATCPQPTSVLSDPITMTVNPNVTPDITITADPGESICAGTEVTFTAEMVNEGTSPFLVWKRNGVPVSNSSPTYVENALSDGDVVMCVLTSSAACADPVEVESGTIQITVLPVTSIALNVVADPSGPICDGTEVTFTADVNDDLDVVHYAWTVNDLPVGQDDDTFSSSGLVDGDVVLVTVTSDDDCLASNSETSAPFVMQVSSSEEPELTLMSDLGTDICEGEAVTFTASVSGAGTSPTYSWTVNGSPAGTDSPTFSIATLADGDVVACAFSATDPCDGSQQSLSAQLTISVGTSPVLSGTVSGPASLCEGTSAVYTVSSVGNADSYAWSLPIGWTGSSASNSISAEVGSDGGTVAVVAQNACGTSTPLTIDVEALPNHAEVSGTVTVNGAPVFNGWVFAYKQQLDTLGYIKADSTVILGGNYSFDELPLYGVPFILKAVATVSAVDHSIAPGTLPTYYAKNTANGLDTVYHQWNRPDFNCSLTAQCGTIMTKNFQILTQGVLDGDCSLNGSVTYYCEPFCKTASEDPIPGVDVVVEKVPPGNAFVWGETGSDGRFRFENVPVDDTYRIYVNIPGIPMTDTYSIEVTPSDTAITELDFVVDTVNNVIFIVEPNGIAQGLNPVQELTLIPNPMSDVLTVVLPAQFGRATGYRIVGMDGRTAVQRSSDSRQRLTIHRDGLPAGVYLLEVTGADGHRGTSRMVVQ